MTDQENLPAEVVEGEVVAYDPMLNARTDSWVSVIEPVADLANKIAGTTFVPEGLRGNVGGTAAGILYGREVGLPPMTMLQTMHVIKGRVGVSAEALRALVLAAGHEIVVRESTGARCVIAGRRRGSEDWTTVEWTLEDAKRAKLGGEGWTKYPRAMLQARASAELCRLAFPDVIHGMAATEELDEDRGDPGASGPAPARSTSRVSRRKKAQPAGSAVSSDAHAPPPLPGEPEYEDPQTGASDASRAADSTPAVSDVPSSEADPAEESTPSVPAGSASPDGEEPSVTKQQMTRLQVTFRALAVDDRDERLSIVGDLLGRPVESATELTKAEAHTLIDTLAACKDRDDLEHIIQAAVSARDQNQDSLPIGGEAEEEKK